MVQALRKTFGNELSLAIRRVGATFGLNSLIFAATQIGMMQHCIMAWWPPRNRYMRQGPGVYDSRIPALIIRKSGMTCSGSYRLFELCMISP